MNNILEIKDVWKSFAGKSNAYADSIPVLKGVSLEVEKNTITALIGGNGAGKTTLLNIVNGFFSPDKGKLVYDNSHKGMLLNNESSHKIARMGIGRLFQGTRLFSELSVRENLLLACNNYILEVPFYKLFAPGEYKRQMQEMDERIETLLLRLNGKEFAEKLDESMDSLSYADQRILNLIALLLGNYKLVLLDEPTSGMNVGDWDIIDAIISEMENSGISVFLIEHNMDFVRRYVKICHYMSSGKIIYSGKTKDVLEHPKVQKEYLAIC